MAHSCTAGSRGCRARVMGDHRLGRRCTALHPAPPRVDRGDAVDRRAKPVGLAPGDVAHHSRGTRRGGHYRGRDCVAVFAFARPRAQSLSLCSDTAGDADRCDRAIDHYLGATALSGASRLRVDRRVLSGCCEHDGRPQQRRPQLAGAIPALRRFTRPDPAVSEAAGIVIYLLLDALSRLLLRHWHESAIEEEEE